MENKGKPMVESYMWSSLGVWELYLIPKLYFVDELSLSMEPFLGWGKFNVFVELELAFEVSNVISSSFDNG